MYLIIQFRLLVSVERITENFVQQSVKLKFVEYLKFIFDVNCGKNSIMNFEPDFPDDIEISTIYTIWENILGGCIIGGTTIEFRDDDWEGQGIILTELKDGRIAYGTYVFSSENENDKLAQFDKMNASQEDLLKFVKRKVKVFPNWKTFVEWLCMFDCFCFDNEYYTINTLCGAEKQMLDFLSHKVDFSIKDFHRIQNGTEAQN